jgi:4a-hydroxytetrahydrobiopterin dehydratase
MMSLNRNELLSDIAIQRGLGQLHPGWTRKGDVLAKTFQFNTFPAGINFVVRVAQAAETAGHHPDIDIRYTKVTCTLTTHDSGGITQKDLDMANEIDFAAER